MGCLGSVQGSAGRPGSREFFGGSSRGINENDVSNASKNKNNNLLNCKFENKVFPK